MNPFLSIGSVHQDVLSYLEASDQQQYRSTCKALDQWFASACENRYLRSYAVISGNGEGSGNPKKAKSDLSAKDNERRYAPYDPSSGHIVRVVCNVYFSTDDGNAELSTEQIKTDRFHEINAEELLIVGMQQIEAIGDGFLSHARARKVSFDGSCRNVKTIGDGFLQNAAELRAVEGLGNFASLRFVGNCWMMRCRQLEKVAFAIGDHVGGEGGLGFHSLETVGDHWLSSCPLLTDVDFTTVSNGDSNNFPRLRSIGNGFLHKCSSLRRVSFRGLDKVATIGDSWLSDCSALLTVDFGNDSGGLVSLQCVGNKWLERCTGLRNVSFAALKSLAAVGSDWLSGCAALTAVDYSANASLEAVEDGWMSYCTSLKIADFSGLSCLQSVGSDWLYGCEDLAEASFEALDSLTFVGDSWLGSCHSLTAADFSPVANTLQSVGSDWLRDCRCLEEVSFDGLSALEDVGDDALAECHCLRVFRANGLSRTVRRQVLRAHVEDDENDDR